MRNFLFSAAFVLAPILKLLVLTGVLGWMDKELYLMGLAGSLKTGGILTDLLTLLRSIIGSRRPVDLFEDF
jgi:hypothetical protein